MNSKEFRIGNYVNFGSTLSVITGVLLENIIFKYNSGGEERHASLLTEGINIIPLTEEWLLKFGLQQNEYFWRIDDFVIKQTYDGYVPVSQKYSIGIELQFVHQLQNLFFALKGKELTLK